jgi:ABC-type multidrug transport system fused ATPase/permease subunit
VAIGYVYQQLAIGYLNTGRDLRRMESNSRSPIFSGFSELLDGIVTVRAFGAEKRFLDSLHGKIDLTMRMFYTFWMLNRHLLLHFDVLGGFAVLVTTLFSLSGVVNAGTAGICITSAMSFTTRYVLFYAAVGISLLMLCDKIVFIGHAGVFYDQRTICFSYLCL